MRPITYLKLGISAALIAGAALLSQPSIRDVLAQGFVFNQMLNGTPTGPVVAPIADQTTGLYFGTNRVGVAGHLEAGLKTTGGAPAVTACGTTPTLATGSTDLAGTITMGTTATGCVLTFGTAFAVAPTCTVTWRATPLASQSYTTSTTALTLTQTSTSNNLADYWCIAKSGG